MMQIAFRTGAPTDIYDKIIKFFTKGNFYHTELIFSNGLAFSADPKEGTRFKHIEDLIDLNKWTVLELPWIDSNMEKRIIRRCVKELGCDYDWKAVIYGWLIRPHGDLDKWYCCEICLSMIAPTLETVSDIWYNPRELYDAMVAEINWKYSALE